MTEKAKRGRPSLPTEARKPRGITRYKKWQIVLGKEILGVTMGLCAKGRRIKYFAFRCDCGSRFKTAEAILTVAVNKSRPLRCNRCAVAGNSKKLDRDGFVSEPGAEVAATPSLLPVTVALICKTAKDDALLAEAKRILARHLRSAVEIVNMDQAWKEAVTVAKLNRKMNGVCGDWTRDNIREWLKRQSYDQYL